MTNENDQQPQQESVFGKAWRSGYMAPLRVPFNIARVVTAPAWWPAKKLFGFEGWKPKALGAVWAAAVGSAIGGAVMYGAALGWVSANNVTTAINWPATEGTWTGRVVRFSQKGVWPCNSYEGEFRTGEAQGVKPFAVNIWQTELIEEIKRLGSNEVVKMTYRNSRLPQETFGTVTEFAQTGGFKVEPTRFAGCIQHYDHRAIGIEHENPPAPVPGR